MAQSSLSPSETVRIVQKLKELFSNENRDREKLEKLIPNVESVQHLLTELLDMITKYERQGEKIDQQTDFLEQLKKF